MRFLFQRKINLLFIRQRKLLRKLLDAANKINIYLPRTNNSYQIKMGVLTNVRNVESAKNMRHIEIFLHFSITSKLSSAHPWNFFGALSTTL